MTFVAAETLTEVLALVGSAIGAAVFTIAGLLVEQAALHDVSAGQTTMGAWELWLGALVLVVGLYILGYRQFWQRLTQSSLVK